MRIYPGTTVDYEFEQLGTLGFTGTLNDRQYASLRNSGFSGAIPDMFGQSSDAAAAFDPSTVEDVANRSLFRFDQLADNESFGTGRVGLDAYHPEFVMDQIGAGSAQVDKSVEPFSSLGYGASYKTDGTAGLLINGTTPDRLKLGGVSEFTIEYYARRSSGAGNFAVCGSWGLSTDVSWLCGFETAEDFFFYGRRSGAFVFEDVAVVSPEGWVHFAVCVSGGTTLQMWENGTRVRNVPLPGALINEGGHFAIGGTQNGPGALIQFYYPFGDALAPRIGPIHVWKGTAKYDGASITPTFPTRPD